MSANAYYLENKFDVVLPYGMAGHISVACLEALIGKGLESHSSTVVRSSLLGVAHPPFDMVKIQKFAPLGFFPLQK